MAVIRVLSVAGDESFEYEPEVLDERLRVAREVCESKLRKGYLAFVPDEGPGGTSTQIRRFDPLASEIILQPPICGG